MNNHLARLRDKYKCFRTRQMLPCLWVATLLVTLPFGCRSTTAELSSGVTAPYLGFVPARTAVLPCSRWPNGASLAHLPLSVEDESVTQGICEQFDKFVIEGYEDQPFMRGYSPRAVARLLEIAEEPEHLDALAKLWQRNDKACTSCQKPASFYVASIAERQPWRVWLQELSRYTRNTDAVLMPFVVFAAEGRFDDRGLFIAQRRAMVVLLLVDTNNGHLIWTGERTAEISQQQLHTSGKVEELTFPEWSLLHPRLFDESIWRDFPGRQYF